MKPGRRIHRGRRVLVGAAIAAGLQGAAFPVALATADRSEEPVLVLGGSFPDFLGRPIPDLYLYRYDTTGSQFVPIPFQIDERLVDRVFKPGTAFEFTQTVYDIFGEDDGMLDADDELAFRFGDAGPQAPPSPPWVGGAEPRRYEIVLTDSRPGAPFATRYVYLFTGVGLPVSPTSYVSWTVSPTTNAITDLYSLEYQDKWLLLGYKVQAPCGTGADMLDRFKVRAGIAPNNSETEQGFNNLAPPVNSTFLGGLSGPIRAIRYVMGAASGVNTIHHDVIYRGVWERHVNLRVHAIAQVWSYFDWLSISGATLYLPGNPGGIAVDGTAETPAGWSACAPGTCGTVPAWALYRSSVGGMAMLMDVPPSPFYTSASAYYLDNSSYSDSGCTPQPACYPDDDDAAHDFGIKINGPSSQCCNTIFTKWSTYALCSNTGDGTLGADYGEFVTSPLGKATVGQWAVLGPIETVTARRSGNDVVLEWAPSGGATGYRVYHSEWPDVPKSSWTPLGDTVATSSTDPGAALLVVPRYYSVVALTPGSEGQH